MYEIIRDSVLGQTIRFVTRNQVLKYIEETPNFKLPEGYDVPEKDIEDAGELHRQALFPNDEEANITKAQPSKSDKDLEKATEDAGGFNVHVPITNEEGPATANDQASYTEGDHLSEKVIEDGAVPYSQKLGTDPEKTTSANAQGPERVTTLPDVNRALSKASGTSARQTVSHSVTPTRTSDGTILVDFYTSDDPANPQNWSLSKKIFVTFQISLYTFAVYVGSSIYVAGEEGIMKRFGVSTEAADLGLALYVIAYGIGPMLFAPLSEIPAVGRNPLYILTYGLFVILCVPAALTPTFGGLLAVRFLLGFFGSPCLAIGGASFADMFSVMKLAYPLAVWSTAAVMGPALGPVISGFSVQAENWRWPQWEMLWLSGPVFLLLFALLPETSADNILLRRAQRLRELTGDPHYLSRSEIKQAEMTAREVAFDALIKPWEINVLDPAVLFSTFYTALIYAIYYSFFESFPFVYPKIYHFNLGENGLAFLSMVVSLGIILPAYIAFFYWGVEPKVRREGFGPPEGALIPGLLGSFLVPAGNFLFAWTTRKSVHWIASMFGVFLDIGGTFLVMQGVFIYLPTIYPHYAASLFAANDCARSLLATAAILWSRPLYKKIGVPAGVSMLGGLTIVCIFGIFFLFFFGARLRARSRFAVK